MRERVEEVIEQVRPTIQMDGADVELVEVNSNIVKVNFLDPASGSPFPSSFYLTFRGRIIELLKAKVPEVERVYVVQLPSDERILCHRCGVG